MRGIRENAGGFDIWNPGAPGCSSNTILIILNIQYWGIIWCVDKYIPLFIKNLVSRLCDHQPSNLYIRKIFVAAGSKYNVHVFIY